MVRPAFLRGQGVTVKVAIRRCAVYTRKSSEEGLEQDFNSLHAQRDACEAFIRSQRGEGWRLVGGFTNEVHPSCRSEQQHLGIALAKFDCAAAPREIGPDN